MFDPPITTTGTILSSPKAKVYLVELPNGKQTIGHVPKSKDSLHSQLVAGTKVLLEMTPYDFEKARIADLAEQNPQ